MCEHILLHPSTLSSSKTSQQSYCCNTRSRTKNEASSVYTIVAVYSSSVETARGASRNEPSKMRKSPSVLGKARYTDRYMDVYEIIACTRVRAHA